MAKKPIFKDKCGKVLTSGDFIVYGHALGRCAGLRYGKVIDVKFPKESTYGKGEAKIPRILMERCKGLYRYL